jgi:hypothetical protein
VQQILYNATHQWSQETLLSVPGQGGCLRQIGYPQDGVVCQESFHSTLTGNGCPVVNQSSVTRIRPYNSQIDTTWSLTCNAIWSTVQKTWLSLFPRLFFWKMKKSEIFQISHGVNPEKFRKYLGSDPQYSRQNLTKFGQKPMIFWNFACFGAPLGLFQKPNRTNPEKFRKCLRADPEGSRQSLAEVKNTVHNPDAARISASFTI